MTQVQLPGRSGPGEVSLASPPGVAAGAAVPPCRANAQREPGAHGDLRQRIQAEQLQKYLNSYV